MGCKPNMAPTRVFDTPINESGIIAMAIGMGANGMRPVAEIQFADYIFPGFDQVVSELSRLRYRSVAQYIAPVTIRTPLRRRHSRWTNPLYEPGGVLYAHSWASKW